MIIKKSTLLALPEQEPKFASTLHGTRWQTLQQLAKSYKATPEKFLTIEICQ